MATASGVVAISISPNASPPPALSAIVTIKGTRGGDGPTVLEPITEPWLSVFLALAEKRATITYTAGTPPTITNVSAG